MSRAYRIKVKEIAKHILRASDHVSAQLELLEILPPERMAELLAAELLKRGFKKQGGKLLRHEADGVVIEVNPQTATVTVKTESEQAVTLESERQSWSAVESGQLNKKDQEHLREQALKDLQRQAEQKTIQLQMKLTLQLEGQLSGLRKELDQAVNRVTADALKEKAAQLGQIKELSEDPQTGSLTIVLEI